LLFLYILSICLFDLVMCNNLNVNCKLYYFPLFILGQLQVHAFMPGCPVCIVKIFLLFNFFKDEFNDENC